MMHGICPLASRAGSQEGASQELPAAPGVPLSVIFGAAFGLVHLLIWFYGLAVFTPTECRQFWLHEHGSALSVLMLSVATTLLLLVYVAVEAWLPVRVLLAAGRARGAWLKALAPSAFVAAALAGLLVYFWHIERLIALRR